MPAPPYLRAAEDFRRAYREGIRIANDPVILHARARGAGPARIGIAVRRQLGTAVRRNRIKRRIREAGGRAYAVLPEGMDVVIVPRASAAEVPFAELVAALTEAFGRVRTSVRP